MDSDTSSQFNRFYPSDEYLEMLLWCRRHHRTRKTFDGTRMFGSLTALKELCLKHSAQTLLDYGCGKGFQYSTEVVRDGKTYASIQEFLGLASITGYDPAWAPAAARPESTFDGAVCYDVLQFIPLQDIPWVVSDILSFCRSFAVVHTANIRKKKAGELQSQNVGRSVTTWLNTLQPVMVKYSSLDVWFQIKTKEAIRDRVCRLQIFRKLPGASSLVQVADKYC